MDAKHCSSPKVKTPTVRADRHTVRGDATTLVHSWSNGTRMERRRRAQLNSDARQVRRFTADTTVIGITRPDNEG